MCRYSGFVILKVNGSTRVISKLMSLSTNAKCKAKMIKHTDFDFTAL